MEPYSLDCCLCIINQTLQAARFAGGDTDTHARIMTKTMKAALDAGLDIDPPFFGTIAHRFVREETRNPDPYYEQKQTTNKQALGMVDLARKWIESADDKFETIVRLAIAGNSIDYALGELDPKEVDKAIRAAIDQPVAGDFIKFRSEIEKAQTILYLTDNAGEIVYDTFLVEMLTKTFKKDVTVVVRGKPILNDALMEDAELVGMTKLAPVIGNGGDGLGVVFELVSDEFKEKFANADLVICKGLANYETLGNGKREITPKKIAFLFKAKCQFIADRAKAKLGDLVVCVQ